MLINRPKFLSNPSTCQTPHALRTPNQRKPLNRYALHHHRSKSVEATGKAVYPRTQRFFRHSSSGPSSESGDSEEYDLLLQAERVQLEEVADKELEAANHKPVAFSVRTNISFDGSVYGLDAPSPSRVVSFETREFLQIKKRFDQNWWIGRRVQIGCPLGFIPSPAKLDYVMSSSIVGTQNNLFGMQDMSSSPNATLPGPVQGAKQAATEPSDRGWYGGHETKGPMLEVSRRRHSETSLVGDGPDDIDEGGHVIDTSKKQHPATPGARNRRKVFSRKPYTVAPYEIVPCMRPVVFVGPALKGYVVTDMMQKAIFDAMKKHFDGRIIVSRVSTNISLAKRVGELLNLDKKNVTDRGQTQRFITLVEVQRDLERIFHLASKMQLLLLDCDTINHPSQISKTCLAPIVVYIKIKSTRVLSRLIKNRGKEQQKNAGVQVAAAEKLLQCPNEAFEYIIDQNNLAGATEALNHFLEGYWSATHPFIEPSKAERILGADLNEPDSDRPLVPMTPGHPGLSVVTKSALDAGFTAQEISALTGARATGWANENGPHADNELGLTGPHYAGGVSVGSEYNTMQTSGPRQLIRRDHEDGEYMNSSMEDLDPDGAPGIHSNKNRFLVGTAHAAAMAAAAAGLTPKPRAVHPSLISSDKSLFNKGQSSNNLIANRNSPGLAMGLGMGLASGVAANFINANLFHHSSVSRQHQGLVAKSPVPSSTVAAAAAAVIKPPPLKDLGIHQVEGSNGTHVYQSRSAQQAKQRQAELDRVRRETEAKFLALQATVGGRRRRKPRDKRTRDFAGEGQLTENDGPIESGGGGRQFTMQQAHQRTGPNPTMRPPQRPHDWDAEEAYAADQSFIPGGNYPGTGPRVEGMIRACPPDD